VEGKPEELDAKGQGPYEKEYACQPPNLVLLYFEIVVQFEDMQIVYLKSSENLDAQASREQNVAHHKCKSEGWVHSLYPVQGL